MTSLRALLDEGLALHRAGRLAEADGRYRQALTLAPDDAEANHLAGVLAFQSGRLADAVARFTRAAEANPGTAKYRGNLGAALVALGRYGEAVDALQRAADLDQGAADILVNLAVACREAGRAEEAVAAARRAVALAPRDVVGWNVLATARLRAGQPAEAVEAARQAVAADPANAEAHNTLGAALSAAGQEEAALASLERAVMLAPALVEARCNLGLALQEARRYAEAAAQYRAAIAARPDDAAGYAGLARVLRLQGSPDEALPLYRRAVELAPGRARLHSGVLFHALGSPDTDGRRLAADHRAWAARFADPLAADAAPHENPRDPDRRLRIGYVSPDLRNHPVGRLLLPILSAHDRNAVETICYADVLPGDATTAALRAAADGWRETTGLDDAALAATVSADAIDILVDLAGHSAHNRLLAFARRPAPVQASWLGYPSTTGMAAIGWLIADPVHAPEGSEDEFAERVIRLPHDLLCFVPPEDAPAVGPLPCRAAGHVTFGSFNNPGKLSAAAIGLWAQVLAAVPSARLLLRYRGLEDAEARRRLAGRFAEAGVDVARLDFAGSADYRAVLDSYNRVDIALDTFPYSGTMTTLEALWMGVPVVALAGDRMAARQSAAHLAASGLAELVVRDADAYVALAASLAADPERLGALRAGMRARIATSPICDVAGFTRALEGAFRQMWRGWCAG